MTTQVQPNSNAGAILTVLFAVAAIVITLAFRAYPAQPDPRQECVSTLAEAGVVTDGRALHRACS
jgi:hypothetical protein